jgi:hypothetical protein
MAPCPASSSGSRPFPAQSSMSCEPSVLIEAQGGKTDRRLVKHVQSLNNHSTLVRLDDCDYSLELVYALKLLS